MNIGILLNVKKKVQVDNQYNFSIFYVKYVDHIRFNVLMIQESDLYLSFVVLGYTRHVFK